MYQDVEICYSRGVVIIYGCLVYTRWPKKSHYQIIEKICLIVLKPANGIRFIGEIK